MVSTLINVKYYYKSFIGFKYIYIAMYIKVNNSFTLLHMVTVNILTMLLY